jgi:hypothetical protein
LAACGIKTEIQFNRGRGGSGSWGTAEDDRHVFAAAARGGGRK